MARLNDLEVRLPSQWVDRSQLVLVGQQQDGMMVNFVVTRDTIQDRDDAKTYAARQLPKLKAALQGYALVKEGPATFGGNAGFLREQTFQAGGSKAAQLQFYVVRDGAAWVMTFTDLAARFTRSRAVAEELLNSARFTSPAVNAVAPAAAAVAAKKPAAAPAAKKR